MEFHVKVVSTNETTTGTGIFESLDDALEFIRQRAKTAGCTASLEVKKP